MNADPICLTYVDEAGTECASHNDKNFVRRLHCIDDCGFQSRRTTARNNHYVLFCTEYFFQTR